MASPPSLVGQWVPVVLRISRGLPSGVLLALAAVVSAQQGWLGRALDLGRTEEITLGIVLAAAALWMTEAVPLFVTSLLVLGLELAWLAPALPHQGGSSLFLNAFFSDVTLLFLGGFVLSAGIERARLDRFVTSALLRWAGGDPTRVLLAMMIATSLVGVWMSNTAACALMLGPAAALLARVPEGDGFRKALLIGIAFSANMGGLATPISSPPNAIVIRYLEAQGSAPSFAMWMGLAVPLLVVLQVLLLIYLARRFPSRVTRLTMDEEPLAFGAPQILVLGVFLLTVAGWISARRLGLTSGTIALLPIVAFFGTNLLRVSELRSLPWDVILLIGGGLALGAAVDQSGLAIWAGSKLPRGLPPFAMMGAVAVFAVVISSVMSNTAAINLTAPIVVALPDVASGPVLLVAAFACTLSMPLPVSTPPNALAYGFSARADGRGELTARDMIVPGMTMTALGLAILALFAAAWFPLLEGLGS